MRYVTLDLGSPPFSMTFLICKTGGKLFSVQWDWGLAFNATETSSTYRVQ